MYSWAYHSLANQAQDDEAAGGTAEAQVDKKEKKDKGGKGEQNRLYITYLIACPFVCYLPVFLPFRMLPT